jgi:hypothetical protein
LPLPQPVARVDHSVHHRSVSPGAAVPKVVHQFEGCLPVLRRRDYKNHAIWGFIGGSSKYGWEFNYQNMAGLWHCFTLTWFGIKWYSLPLSILGYWYPIYSYFMATNYQLPILGTKLSIKNSDIQEPCFDGDIMDLDEL